MSPRKLSVLILVLSLSLLACRGASAPPQPRPVAPPMPTATAISEPPAAPTEVTATEVSPPDAPVTPSAAIGLFDLPFTERAIFEQNLLPAEQGVLQELTGATVYHLAVTLNDSLDSLFADQAVWFTNTETEPLNEVYFRLYPNLFGGETKMGQVTVNEAEVSPSFELQASAMRIPLSQPLAPGESVEIGLRYQVSVPQAGGGNYGVFIFDQDVLALAHFYPIVAVYNEGTGWDLEIPAENGDVIYADASFYVVDITAPAGVTVVASGSQFSAEGETQRFVGGPMRDFYVAASRAYGVVSQTEAGVTVNSYYLPGGEAGAQAGLQQALDSLRSFGQRFGPYPYPEFDIVPTPTLALGVEYPGIIAMNLRLYKDPDQVFESTIAHEVAHQWFYGVVGNDQLAEPWLDEALAQYLTYLYYVDNYSQAAALGYRQSWAQRWNSYNQAETPIGLPVEAYEDGRAYSGIIYGRGPFFYDTVAQSLGGVAVSEAIRAYYQDHKWALASTESLRASLEGSCQCNLSEIFTAWVYNE